MAHVSHCGSGYLATWLYELLLFYGRILAVDSFNIVKGSCEQKFKEKQFMMLSFFGKYA